MARIQAPAGTIATPLELHRSRRVLFAVAVLLSLALTATVIATYLQIRSSLTVMAQSQGQRWLGDIARLARPEVLPDDAGLAELLAENRAAGLTCIAVFGLNMVVVTELGDCPDHKTLRESLRGQPGATVKVGSRLRMATSPPPPRDRPREGQFFSPDAPPDDHRPPRRRGPPDDRQPHPRPPPRLDGPDGAFSERPPPPHRGPRPTVIEFEPLFTQRLLVSAQRTVMVSLVSAAMLVVVAGAFSRFTVRAERSQETRSRERHLAALGEMSAVLAHEIRNPLTSMKGHAQLLLEQLPDGAPGQLKAARVAREIERLERLVEDLLSYARSPQLRCRPTDPTTLLQAAAAEVAGIQLEVHVDRAPKVWRLDPDRMRQVLQNVLQNAQHVSPERVEAMVEKRDNRLVFSVRDHGPGLAAGDEDKIFEPFHTRKVRGTGLGLALAQQIVALHGGTIQARNHPEGGALFVITLPTVGEDHGHDSDR